MNADEVRTLYEYAYWARDRLLTAADGLSDQDFVKPNGFTYGSLRGILVHALAGEGFWCNRFLDQTSPTPPGEEEVPSVAALTTVWAEHEARMRGFLATVTEAALNQEFVVKRRSGEELRSPLWQLMVHVVNHGTQHRSEAAEALTMIDRSPGSLDFTTFIWERGASESAKA